MRPLLPVLAVLACACAPKQVTWTHPSRSDEVQLQKDRYECLKEARYSSDEVSITSRSARRGTEMKVDDTLMDACMRARGYVPVEPEKQARGGGTAVKEWALRGPEADAIELEGAVGLSNTFGIRRRAYVDLQAWAVGDLLAPEVSESAFIRDQWLVVPAGVGVIVPLSEQFEVRGRLHFRAAPSDTTPDVVCGNVDGFYVNSCERYADSSSAASPLVVGDLGWRPPGFPRLSLRAGLGVQVLPGGRSVGRTVEVEDDQTDETKTYDLSFEGGSSVVAPLVRLGTDFDVVHAKPVGAGLGCFVDVLARSRIVQGTESPGSGVIGGCMLQLRVRPQPLSE